MKLTSKKIAYASIISALGFILLYLGAILDIFDLCMIVLTSFLIYITLLETNAGYSFLIVAVTFTLSILLLPNKYLAIEYLTFGGLYPVLKFYFEKLNKILSYIVKFLYFNVILTGLILLAQYVFMLPEDAGMSFSALAYILGNLFFTLADLSFTAIKINYVTRLRNRLKIYKFFR